MKNIFSYQYGSIFTGKEIKEYLLYRQAKGYSLYRLKQFLNCKDDREYILTQVSDSSGSNPKYYKSFIRKK